MEALDSDPATLFDEISDYSDTDSDNEDFSPDCEDIIKKDRICSGIDTLADLDSLKGHMHAMCVRACDFMSALTVIF